MGKGGSTAAPNAALTADENALTAIAQAQAGNSQQLFNASFPGFQTAENFAQTAATGDPYALARITAPAVQQITQASTGAKRNIIDNAPNGGEKNLALEQVDVNRGAQVGSVASNAYLNSFQQLASFGGQGIGLGTSAANTAVGGYNSAGGLAGVQLQNATQQKGNSLGAFSSLGGDAASLGGDVMGKGGKGGSGSSSPLSDLASLGLAFF